MKVQARAGDLITDLLFKKTGSDDDELEREFFHLNPHVRRDIFQEDCLVIIPKNMTSTRKQTVTRSWG
ncbi:putative phage tail X protein [Aliivibrio wodanis]|uniref:Putative phage tail X protein n=1 Tax=Aliivibrio wodanis TaxID=80852 RepID=A0A090IT45_9GAMM|nr:putative phage tail X protein [Aliivibrio wodanis]